MQFTSKRTVAIVAALVVAALSGAAFAASRSDDTGGQGLVNNVAERLGVEPKALEDAMQGAAIDRIDAAVAAGRLSEAEASAIKEAIRSGEGPPFGALGPGGPNGCLSLDAAATYLGLTETQLREQVSDGKTLAQIAKDRGKSVDGLKDALTAAAKTRLNEAVEQGRFTQAQANAMLERLQSKLDDLVNSNLPARPDGFGGPPGGLPGGPPDGSGASGGFGPPDLIPAGAPV